MGQKDLFEAIFMKKNAELWNFDMKILTKIIGLISLTTFFYV